MANLRDLKSRIGTIKNIKQITNAMKMVAAAKLRKAQDAVTGAKLYAERVDVMLRILQKKNRHSTHPMLASINPAGKELLIVVTADKGLCGSFNSLIQKFTLRYLDNNPNCDLIFYGKKGYDFFRRKEIYSIISNYENMSEIASVPEIHEYKKEIIDLYNSGKYSKVSVIYNEFKSAIHQNLTHKQILPVVPHESEEISHIDYIYEPDEDTIIDELGNRYLNVGLWMTILESTAAEQGARMTAMDNATTNAKDLIEELSLIYNRERQAQITTQIIEVASGAEAINS